MASCCAFIAPVLLWVGDCRYHSARFYVPYPEYSTNHATLHTALLCLLLVASPSAADTLVVCPTEFRPALAPWQEYRRWQGHEILVVEPPVSGAQLRATIGHIAKNGTLKYLVLIGDVPGAPIRPTTNRTTIPTNYVSAKINTRWGSEPTIASDIPFADVDGDEVPDLAVGRIPADSATELAAVVRKVLQYEQQAKPGPWERRLHVVAGAGGFGAMTDALVEAAGRNVIRQTMPPECDVRYTSLNPAHPDCPSVGKIRSRVRGLLSESSLAWIYLGHGLPAELDRARNPTEKESILSVDDVPLLRCSAERPLAVLVACYAGAFDAPRDCLAEELALAENGPIAVIAATRVTMPYGNTALGYELLQACFHDRPPVLGDILKLAQERLLHRPEENSRRASLDAMAQGLSPPPVDLPAEQGEHVLMYHLLGDPLLRLRCPRANVAHSVVSESLAK